MNATPKKFLKVRDEPTMSDATLLLKVEDFINLAFGKADENIVNFTMLHSILRILGTQMRILEQDVEIRFSEEDEILAKILKAYGFEDLDEAEKIEEEEVGKGTPLKGEKLPKVEKKGKTKPEKGKQKENEKKKEQREEPKDKPISTKIPKSADATTQGEGTKEDDKAAGSVTRIGSIEVVTPSQFKSLEMMVEELLKRTGGVPLPTLPSNEDLLAELAKGTASLPDTMEAMQVCARVETAEKVISKMAEILTELALSGALPPEVAETIAIIQDDMQQLALGADPESFMGRNVAMEVPSETIREISATSALAMTASDTGKVTYPELHDVLDATREELMQEMTMMMAKAESTIEKANESAKAVEEKVDVAKTLNDRISKMLSLTDKEMAQLNGFDVVMVSQLEAFNEQMNQLRSEVTAGIVMLDSINNNAEAVAMNALGIGYENLLVEMEKATNSHGAIVMMQKKLSDDLKGLINCVDLMREEKADSDEVADGLRDKANIGRLKGLVKLTTFEASRQELENQLAVSHEKFTKQEQAWMVAMKEVEDIIENKAGFLEMLALRQNAMQAFTELYAFLRRLEVVLGDPKTAMLTRQLSRNAYCGPCLSPALMDIYDKRSGAPPKLPALLPHKDAEVATTTNIDRVVEDTNKHVCKRWVGGSHTLLTDRVSHEHGALAPNSAVPTKQYTGYGTDGRLYLMEEELEPCLECNKLEPVNFEGVQVGGGGIA